MRRSTCLYIPANRLAHESRLSPAFTHCQVTNGGEIRSDIVGSAARSHEALICINKFTVHEAFRAEHHAQPRSPEGNKSDVGGFAGLERDASLG